MLAIYEDKNSGKKFVYFISFCILYNFELKAKEKLINMN